MKVLVAVDGSPFTKRMLAYLAAHDEWLGPQHSYKVLHAVQAVPPRAASLLGKDTVKAHYDDTAEKVFRPIRRFFTQQGLDARFVYTVGPAGSVIAKAAQQGNYGLLVLGSRGFGTLKNLVLGSVATQVLAGCETPVLLIR